MIQVQLLYNCVSGPSNAKKCIWERRGEGAPPQPSGGVEQGGQVQRPYAWRGGTPTRGGGCCGSSCGSHAVCAAPACPETHVLRATVPERAAAAQSHRSAHTCGARDHRGRSTVSVPLPNAQTPGLPSPVNTACSSDALLSLNCWVRNPTGFVPKDNETPRKFSETSPLVT